MLPGHKLERDVPICGLYKKMIEMLYFSFEIISILLVSVCKCFVLHCFCTEN